MSTDNTKLNTQNAKLLLAVALYTLLALAVTWPVAPNMAAALVGRVGGVDAYQNAWNLWWTAHALSSGESPFETPLLYYPQGVDLFWQTLGFAQGVAALPVTLALGPLAAVNWTVLCSFVVGGAAVFVFARRLTGSASAALVAGAVYAFSPFHMEKVLDGNIEVAAIHWVPCYALALYLLLERPAWWRALLAGLLLLWVSLGSWYYGMFCVLYTGCAALVWAFGRGRREAARLLAWGVVPLLVWGLVLAPRIGGLAQSGDSALQDMRAAQAERSADLLDFFLPNPSHPLWGHAVWQARERVYPGAVIWNVALGWVGLLLGGVGALACRRETWRWSLLLLATALLALGPALKVAGVQTGLPLPFALIQDLPGIRAGQRPNHMALLSSLMLALLAAYGVQRLAGGLGQWPRRALAGGLVLAVVAIDGYAGPLELVRREVHPFYARLPAPDGALLPLPLYININRSDNLTPQMAHHWPIAGGYVARPPAYSFAAETPGIVELQYGVAAREDIVSPGWPEAGRRALAAYAVRYVTLDLTAQKDDYFAQTRAVLAELGAGPPLLADARLEVYALPRDWPAGPLGFLGAGWQPVERQDDAGLRWRWMAEAADLRLYNPGDRPVLANVTLAAASYDRPRLLALALDGRPLGEWEVQPGAPQTRLVRLVLPPGLHTLGLAAPADPDPGRAGAPISVRLFRAEFGFKPLE
ncbi:MAG: hypothetical protein OHK0022_23330 [Roseiflexaceae bacterium]